MSWLLDLLNRPHWEDHEAERLTLQHWTYAPLLVKATQSLDRDALYHSQLHGEDHIERVMLNASLLAQKLELAEADVVLLLDAASYHDTGRVDDSVDDCHGLRSARNLEQLTSHRGDDLLVLQAAVEGHSRADEDLEGVISRLKVVDVTRARMIARVLKDADGLDRVRLNDLNERFLRFPFSREMMAFARWTYLDSQRWKNARSS